jgi:hypothetical protein
MFVEAEREARDDLIAQGVPDACIRSPARYICDIVARIARTSVLCRNGCDAARIRDCIPATLFLPAAWTPDRRGYTHGAGRRRRPMPVIRTCAPSPRAAIAEPCEQVQVYMTGRWHATPLYRREALRSGDRLYGPAIIVESNATTVVDPGWVARGHGARAFDHDACEPRARGTAAARMRPRDTGGVRQSFHVDCRTDGVATAAERPLGQHQGAIGFLLRDI